MVAILTTEILPVKAVAGLASTSKVKLTVAAAVAGTRKLLAAVVGLAVPVEFARTVSVVPVTLVPVKTGVMEI